MTLVAAALASDGSSVCIAADSKVTWQGDATLSRQIYTSPVLKVILLDDDIAVGCAGAGPAFMAEKVAGLRGHPVIDVLDSLRAVAGSSFLVVQRAPARIWRVSAEDGVEDLTSLGRGWIGEHGAFNEFQQRFDDFAGLGVAFQVQSTMQHVVHALQHDTVQEQGSIGGFVVMANATPTSPFRYVGLQSDLAPAAMGPPDLSVSPGTSPGTVNATLKFDLFERPLTLRTLPGDSPTPCALGLYVENAHLGHLFSHEEPAVRILVRARSAAEFAAAARNVHGQHLTEG